MQFPEPHIRAPRNEHTHTAIVLHGRGSDGPEFAEELFSSVTSQGKNLPDSLPNFRWVFPTSGDRWSARFQEDMPSWFDAYSLEDIEAKQELQVDGLRESVMHMLELLDREIEQVGGNPHRVYLGGISQGMATALWTLLCAPGRTQGPLGGVLGFCGWLPYAGQAENLIKGFSNIPDRLDVPSKRRQGSQLLLDVIAGPNTTHINENTDLSVLSTAIFLSHGSDDEWVPVRLGRQAARVLQGFNLTTEYHEFIGAEVEGHWIAEPKGFDQIVRFIQKQVEQNH
ncbi:uncharacterized protein N7484_009796 [Penicillium longicatenatum]|uniref:uncharacterized protein n=1 Tax=Penicillium longicatenatum TaxID=1561947 RepID=UPI00254994C6|nr:uncharacterized protein N7484_009796 [Penicillium longicatenatum]KAJ5636483.1 hypothetical protein N7484_009796 [Penicillium longicatenatum]